MTKMWLNKVARVSAGKFGSGVFAYSSKQCMEFFLRNIISENPADGCHSRNFVNSKPLNRYLCFSFNNFLIVSLHN